MQLGKIGFVNMAATVGRLLSFSKNAKVFVTPLRLSVVPVHRYSVEVSSTGEAITHTGQVRFKVSFFETRFGIIRRPNISLAFRQVSLWVSFRIAFQYDMALNVSFLHLIFCVNRYFCLEV